MRILVATFVRQRLRSPVRLALLFTVFAFSLLPAVLARSLAQLDDTAGMLFALILAAGAIGQDVSSGVIQLTLARPVVRWHYVAARWLGASLMAGAVVALFMLAITLGITSRGGVVAAGDVARLAAELVLAAFGMAAVVVGLSSLVNGLADVGVVVVLTVTAGILQLVATMQEWRWLVRFTHEVTESLSPSLPLGPWLQGDWSAWPALASYLSTVSLGLAVAAWSMSRREFSYAAD